MRPVFFLLAFILGAAAASSVSKFNSSHGGSMRRLLHAGHDHSAEDYYSDTNEIDDSELVANKGGSIPVFFIVPFIGVWTPFFLPINKELLKYGVLFGAGLFFTIALEHLIAGSASGFKSLTTDSYPYAYLTVVLGYMLTWLTDIIVNAIWSRKAEELQMAVVKASGGTGNLAGEFEPLSCCKGQSDVESNATKKCPGVNCGCNGANCQCSSVNEESAVLKAGTALGATLTGHKEVYAEMGVKELGVADLVLLLLAMCFHSVFEGLAVGLSGTVRAVWKNVFSIVIHKFFEGIALGASLKAQDTSQPVWRIFLYASFFSIMAPVGIAIGIALDTTVESRTAVWVDTVGNAIAAGVFIFIAVNHLMAKGFRKGPNDRWFTPFIKWFACGLGVMTTSLIQLQG